jgi:hypothetical protein
MVFSSFFSGCETQSLRTLGATGNLLRRSLNALSSLLTLASLSFLEFPCGT